MKTHPYIQPGDGLATHNFFSILRPLSLLSLIIRVFTKCHWNHIACAVLHEGELCVVEAWWPCAKKPIPLQEWLDTGKKNILRLRPKGDFNLDYYQWVIQGAVGVKYDIWALFAQAGFRLRKKRKWRGRGESTAHLKYYCSEVFMRAHQRPEWWTAAPVEAVNDPYFDQFFLRYRGIGQYV